MYPSVNLDLDNIYLFDMGPLGFSEGHSYKKLYLCKSVTL